MNNPPNNPSFAAATIIRHYFKLNSAAPVNAPMQRNPDDLFKIRDLSILKSPLPAHLQRPAAATGLKGSHHHAGPFMGTPPSKVTAANSTLFSSPNNNGGGLLHAPAPLFPSPRSVAVPRALAGMPFHPKPLVLATPGPLSLSALGKPSPVVLQQVVKVVPPPKIAKEDYAKVDEQVVDSPDDLYDLAALDRDTADYEPTLQAIPVLVPTESAALIDEAVAKEIEHLSSSSSSSFSYRSDERINEEKKPPLDEKDIEQELLDQQKKDNSTEHENPPNSTEQHENPPNSIEQHDNPPNSIEQHENPPNSIEQHENPPNDEPEQGCSTQKSDQRQQETENANTNSNRMTFTPPNKNKPTSTEITVKLANWCFAMVPNNSKFTKVSREETNDWIVLVGKRPDIEDLWHSSIVTERIDATQISTGSGKLYQLTTEADELGMMDHGFSPDFASSFRHGFPEDWKALLLREMRRLADPPPKTEDDDGDEKTKEPKEQDEEEKTETERKTAAEEAALTGEVPKKKTVSRNRLQSPSKEMEKLSIKGGSKKNTSDSPKTPSTPSSAAIVRTTRSGRMVVPPQAYWENKYYCSSSPLGRTRSVESSTSSDTAVGGSVKRKWGNQIEIESRRRGKMP